MPRNLIDRERSAVFAEGNALMRRAEAKKLKDLAVCGCDRWLRAHVFVAQFRSPGYFTKEGSVPQPGVERNSKTREAAASCYRRLLRPRNYSVDTRRFTALNLLGSFCQIIR
jgi:hypothetical protein